MLAGGSADASNRVGEFFRVEFAWNPKRDGQVKVAHPKAINSRQGCDRIRILDALGSLNLAKKRASAIRG